MTDTRTSESAKQFEALLTPLLGLAYGVAYNLSHNRADAEDLVQDAAIQAYRHFDRFQQGTNFKAWFLKILTNEFLQKRRKEKRTPEILDIEEAPDLFLYDQTRRAGLHEMNTDPAAALLGKLTAEEISEAMVRLPEEFRVVSVLYFMEEFSYQEIAEVLDVPVGTVRSRLHRGRKLLQKNLWHIAQEHGIVPETGAEEK
jgi:RNA polymerase sigma-70 factor (ECF subfamily)